VIDRFNDERLRCKEQALWAAYYLSKTGNYSKKGEGSPIHALGLKRH
jgi:hypothetical protein